MATEREALKMALEVGLEGVGDHTEKSVTYWEWKDAERSSSMTVRVGTKEFEVIINEVGP